VKDWAVHFVETKAYSERMSKISLMLHNSKINIFKIHTAILWGMTQFSQAGAYQSVTKMEAAYAYNKFIQTHQTARCQYPEDHNMNFHRRGNVKFDTSRLSFATISSVQTLGTGERSRVGSLLTVIQALLRSLIRCRPSRHPQHYLFLK
jgi:hypothetical protein